MQENQGASWQFGKTAAKNMGLTKILNKHWRFAHVIWERYNEHKTMLETYLTNSKWCILIQQPVTVSNYSNYKFSGKLVNIDRKVGNTKKS